MGVRMCLHARWTPTPESWKLFQALNEFGSFAECLMASYSKQVLESGLHEHADTAFAGGKMIPESHPS